MISLTLLGIFLGIGLVILLPLVYAIWLRGWFEDTLAYWTGAPHVCDGGALPHSDEDLCKEHGVKPDRCLMCAIEAPDDDEKTEQAFDVAARFNEVFDAPKKPILEDAPLPAVFEAWLRKNGLR